MHESARFLRSLEHDNPAPPRVVIDAQDYENLEIHFRGQVMRLPMAEVLAFARRWESDARARQASAAGRQALSVCPYPLLGVKLDDPDVTWDGP